MAEEKKDPKRFNPKCPKCDQKMSATITGRYKGRYKCDHCDTKSVIEKDIEFIRTHMELGLKLPPISLDVETTPNKNGDVFLHPFTLDCLSAKYYGKLTSWSPYRRDRPELRAALQKTARFTAKEIAQMSAEQMRETLLRMVDENPAQKQAYQSMLKEQSFARVYGATAKHINKLVDRAGSFSMGARAGSFSMGAKVAESSCSICAARYKLKKIFEIEPKASNVDDGAARMNKVTEEMITKVLEREFVLSEERLQKAELEKRTKMFKPHYCKKCGHDRGCMHPREEEPKKPKCNHPFLIHISPRVANEIVSLKQKAYTGPKRIWPIFQEEDAGLFACRECRALISLQNSTKFFE